MRELVIPAELYDELARAVLGKGGCLRFTARGFSMHPFLRDGDTVVVKPVEASQLEPGSVAFCRSSTRKLVAHRVIAVDSTPDAADSVIIVRGEAAPRPQEKVRSADVLGQVVSVERSGRVMSLDRGWGRLVQRLSVTCRPLALGLSAPRESLKRIASRVLRGIQSLKLYRIVAKRCMGSTLRYQVINADAAHGVLSVSYMVPLFSLNDSRMQLGFRSGEAPAFRVIASLGGRELGSLTLRRFDDLLEYYPDWWLLSLWVHPLLRGAGVGEHLTRVALCKASEHGAVRVNVLVQEAAGPAVKLYEKLGFEPWSVPRLEAETSRQAELGGPKLRIMSKTLP